MELQQKPLNKDQCRGEKPEELEAGAIHHCHHNRKATEDRAQEQTCAECRLRAASGVCLVFMIAEVVVFLKTSPIKQVNETPASLQEGCLKCFF